MKRRVLGIAAVAVTALMSSCAMTLPVTVTENPIGSKTGVSESVVIFGSIYLNGDYGVADAAEQGKIKGGISTVDEKTTNYVVFQKKEMIVTGE
ncbi:MAG: hypothetical protein GY827_00335 [Cytophagales bacterium]|nr:hypothetical protein [Cytophagales bacterium]